MPFTSNRVSSLARIMGCSFPPALCASQGPGSMITSVLKLRCVSPKVRRIDQRKNRSVDGGQPTLYGPQMFLDTAAVGGIRSQLQVPRKVGAGGGHVLGLQVDQAALTVLLCRIWIGLKQQT